MSRNVEHIQAAAFDLDGTLCDSIPDLADAANAMRGSLGLPPLPYDVVEGYVGDGIAVLVHRALSGNPNGRADEGLWERGFALFVRHYARHIADKTRPYPETEAGLGLLRSLGIPLAVVTNKSELLAVKLLKALGLSDYFTLVIGGDSLAERKPSPLPLLHTAEVLGVAAGNMLMVGDSRNDMLAAKAAGCFCIGVDFGYGDMGQLAQNPDTKPDLVVSSLPEIYQYLHPKRENGWEAV
ncbi:MAG: phosphoglycolate phosphatase [Neisseria sp.]|nr:phosphoglycolate phosphatase [Neisseria sp.]